jgi:hypothetical protein
MEKHRAVLRTPIRINRGLTTRSMQLHFEPSHVALIADCNTTIVIGGGG